MATDSAYRPLFVTIASGLVGTAAGAVIVVCLILTLPGKVEPAFKLFFFLHLSPSVLIGSAAGGALGLIVGAMYAMVVGLGSALDWIARRWAERPSR